MTVTFSHATTDKTDVNQIVQQLCVWLSQRLEENAFDWLGQSIQQLQREASEKILFTRFSASARKVGKADLALTDTERAIAQILCPGWEPGAWSVDQAARTCLLLSFPATDADRYGAAMAAMFAAADVAEQVALYQSLPLFPYPERFQARAIEGLRTNITAVFNAIALNNPYPAQYFDEAAWNQMVLKALFVESQLSQIQGLDERANANLARMLSDYAHERWAAGRTVNPQLWRPLGPFAGGALVADLARVVDQGQPFEQAAAALACASSQAAEAQALLDRLPTLKQQIADHHLTWESFSQRHR